MQNEKTTIDMKHKFNSLKKTVWLLSSVLVLASCESDAWKDHYQYNGGGTPVKTLAETLSGNPDAEKFVQALKNTYMFNGDKQMMLTYWEMLKESQFLTVWLPLESKVPDSIWTEALKDLTDKTKDHKKVSTQFILNHIAHFNHAVSGSTKGKIYMLSDKSYETYSDKIDAFPYLKTNIRCTNGIIHEIDGYLDYRTSIYEYLVNSPEYKNVLGDWLKKYTIEEVDAKKSVAAGINSNGEMEYVDSVMVKTSVIMKKYGLISAEDSSYYLVLADPEVWANKYEEVKPWFTYAEYLEGSDSLQEYNTQCALLTDAFFNMNIQKHPEDEIQSTLYNRYESYDDSIPYHVYKYPSQPGGLFDTKYKACSNGRVYIWDRWPFDDSRTFNRTIKLEAENAKIEGNNLFTNPRYVTKINGQNLEKMITVMEVYGNSKDWQATFSIDNNLKGKYNVKIVMAPNDTKKYKGSIMKYKFHPSVTYIEQKSTATLLDQYTGSGPKKKKTVFENDVTKLDTISIGTIDVPACNYNLDSKLRLTIECYIYSNDVQDHTEQMWIDCIMLEPVVE